MDGWNTTFLLGFGLFSGAFAVSFREGMPPQIPTTTPIHDAIFSRRFFPCHVTVSRGVETTDALTSDA